MQGVHLLEIIDFLWYLKFIQHVGDAVLELAITIAWSIWFNWNQVRHGQSCQFAAMILDKARSLIDEFQVANFQPSPLVVKEVEIWINPKPP